MQQRPNKPTAMQRPLMLDATVLQGAVVSSGSSTSNHLTSGDVPGDSSAATNRSDVQWNSSLTVAWRWYPSPLGSLEVDGPLFDREVVGIRGSFPVGVLARL